MNQMHDYNYYAILELEPGASEKEIKKSFRALALRYHPDKNPGDPEAERRFKEIASAYDVLADPSKKSAYDLSRAAGGRSRPDFSSSFWTSPFAGSGCGGGGCCERRGRGRGRAFGSYCVVELSPEEARIGTEKSFIVETSSGHGTVTVDIPPGAEDGAVYRVEGYTDDLADNGFEIYIRIVS